ncbi:arginyl-tRNA synthetase [Planifilum fulgidum]|jgi:arginyl-tRNA synthetase|uniref:Arginine--tRNA ligase n=1 Tax=Planifilum fulgidum TaxID=201973 RepID=A0A1I2LI83_9BACL|nr:arginine--tRNA ligase [Planifilum fulgidum]MBO2496376.1 arginine--tRNA ligase [Bacillota bacterium]MBO2531333.1 arginine--tRNA ligase [Thermoactinomycetaceae bacterium]SFF78763.1 arginyl-tRNA synthetase [Planifilum fulgidum]
MTVLMKIRETLREEIRKAVLSAGLASEENMPEVELETPREKAHGDLATNVAMRLTRIARSNPREIAARIVEGIDRKRAHVRDIQVAGPGFINFFLDRSFLTKVLEEIQSAGDRYGRSEAGRGQRVNVEFVSANPTGSLHLGHARGAAVGDALCNILEAAGYDVTREYYINDAGNQIRLLALSLEARYLEALGRESSFPEDGYRGQDIIDIARELAEREGDSLLSLDREERLARLREYGLKRMLDKIRRDLERYRVRFDVWFSERSLYESGAVERVLKELGERGYTYEKDGALWLKSTAFGDDKDRVLVKSDGSYTYLTPDIAYHRDKLNRGFDRLINIWGADHHGYIPRMKAAIAAQGYDPERLTVLVTQMVKLYQGGELVKMSKRTGKAVTLEELMDEVGVDAVRYFFVMRSPDSHLDFDMDLAISRSNENPVYYVQYAHARIQSVFRQARERGLAPAADPETLSLLAEEQEYDLMKALAAFPDEVAGAAEQLAPQRVVRYLHDLAALFHSYYRAYRVIGDDENLSRARLALLSGVAQVIRNGLSLIGVSAPDHM